MKHDVYVLGSVNVDLMISANRVPNQGETISGYDFLEEMGGKGSNQASACAKLGARTTLIGSVGRDYYGQRALDSLIEQGVVTQHVAISESEHTGTAMILKTNHDNRIIINQGANANIDIKRLHKALSGKSQDLFLTQFEIPLYAVLEGLTIARQKNMITFVNPAPAVVMDTAFYPLIDYLIVNQSESETLSGIFPHTEADCEHAAAFFMNNGVKHIIFTLGGDGSILVNHEGVHRVQPYSVDVVDTTGAGDAFIGTLVWGLSENYTLTNSLQFASAAGAIACTKPGAQKALATRLELMDFIAQEALI